MPDDVAVIGYLNHYVADWIDPALTTLDLQHALAAREQNKGVGSLYYT